jgi:dolichol-phosphate mannosyltransferase
VKIIAAIVTPVGNEIEIIGDFYKKMIKSLPKDFIWILVFDDYCKDGTYEWVLENINSNVYPIHIGKGEGVAKAYLVGYKYALKMDAEKVIEIDIGHPIELINCFVDALDRNPTVFGTRYGKGKMNQKLSRKMISICGTILSKVVLRLPYSDCTSGLQGVRVEVLKKMDLDNFLSRGHFYQTEFKYYCKNIPFEEIPFTYVGNQSSIKMKDILKSIILLFKMLKRKPILLEK